MRHAGLLALAACLAAARAAAADAGPPADRFRFDLGWDRGITYRWVSALDDLDPTGLVGDTVLEGRIGGSLYLDGGWGAGAALSEEGFLAAVRRARLYTSGALLRHLETEYKFEFAIEDRDLYLNDFYLRWRPERVVDTVRVGYFDAPVGFENLVASSSRALMETAAPVSAFVPGFRLGIETSGVHADPSLTWFLHLSSIGQSQQFGDASDQPLRAGGRLVWRPWGGEAPDARALLHLGASVGYAPSGGEVQHRARPESFLSDYVVDTGDVDGGNTLVGVESVWRRGPLVVQGELLGSFLHGTDAGDPLLWGAYVQADLSLTGEVRRYDVGQALFGRMSPRSPLSFGRRGTGAVELAARLAWLDLSEEGVDGGRLLTLSLGPVWTWNKNVRLLGGWVLGHVSSRPDDGALAILQIRLELAL
jgi:phosphate-selective porin OprO/OprP